MSLSNTIVTDPTILYLVTTGVPIAAQVTSLQAMILQAQTDITTWQASLTSLTQQYATIQTNIANRLLQLGVPS
jgi:hypothetical protein